jgi:hypothetical protein
LRLGKHVIEGASPLAHFTEDKVTGAIDNAGSPFNQVGGQALAHGLDNGDAASYRGTRCQLIFDANRLILFFLILYKRHVQLHFFLSENNILEAFLNRL